jgi:uncharacterized protein (DUF2249 family)
MLENAPDVRAPREEQAMTAEPITITEHGTPTSDHPCNCGHDEESAIVLDARLLPHAIRHAAIFGALDSIQPGFALDLIAPHDPLPLLEQLEQRHPGRFGLTYLQQGPEAWTIRFTPA